MKPSVMGMTPITIVSEGEDVYRILQLDPVAEVMVGIFKPLVGDTVPDALITAYQSAVDEESECL